MNARRGGSVTELKTRETDASVDAFVNAVENERRRADTRTVLAIMERVTGETPKMWGDSLIGFGHYHYRYASGREGDWFVTGVSPRKQALTVYIMPGFDAYPDLMAGLGKYRTGKSCLYINKLDDVDLATLEALIRASVASMREPGGP